MGVYFYLFFNTKINIPAVSRGSVGTNVGLCLGHEDVFIPLSPLEKCTNFAKRIKYH